MTDTTTAERVKPEDLYASAIDSGSITIDWSEAKNEHGEPRWYSVEAFDYEADGKSYVLVARQMDVVAVYLPDGTRIDRGEYDEYAEQFEDAEDSDDPDQVDQPAITEDEFDALLDVDPYQWGAEGPMMNYYYPLHESVGALNKNVFGPYDHRYDEIEAAYRLRNQSICLVCLDDEDYALALTGGGMDMTWTIIAGFVALHQLPPVHFCSPPGFRDQDEDYLVACMAQSLRTQATRAQRQLDRLLEQYPQLKTQPQAADTDTEEAP